MCLLVICMSLERCLFRSLAHFLLGWSFFKNLFILIGGQLLYNIMVVVAIHWHESAVGIPRFLRNLHTVLHSGYTSLHSHQPWNNVPFSPHPLQHLLFVEFLMMTILTHVRWCLSVVLVCSCKNEWCWASFMRLLALCVCSLEKCLFRSLPTLWLGRSFFWYWAACIFWILILRQLFYLLLFSPILRAVFSPCL